MPECTTNQENNPGQGPPKRKARYAIVGLGYLAQVAVLPAFAHAKENSELKALVIGDPTKAKQLSRKYRVPLTWSYENSI
ncbi:MAG: hypothetical protein WBC04_00065 [Candidatus Acidiferrales bacterium]